MLEKLAAIADFADNNGHYETANELTQVIKNAQFFDALKTLFDPSSSEMGVDSGFLNRLTRGWRKGKFDRRLGLALAINEERTKLNRKIQEMAAPIKAFSDEISGFYDKVKSGGDDYNSQDFKDELRSFKDGVRKMQKLVGDKKLRKALDLRNKLNVQQIAAVEKITGLDPEHKDFLIKLFNGEIKGKDKPEGAAQPGAVSPAAQAVPGVPPADQATPEQQRIRAWLKTLPMPKMEYDEGLTSNRSRGLAWTIFTRWGRSPMAMKAYFDQHPDKQEEGAYLFGKPFHKVFTDVRDVMRLEKDHGKPQEQKVEAPKEEQPTTEPIQFKSPHGLTPEEEELRVKEVTPAMAKAREEAEQAKAKVKEYQERAPGGPKMEQELATSAAKRVAREITRFGRVQKLRKLNEDN